MTLRVRSFSVLPKTWSLSSTKNMKISAKDQCINSSQELPLPLPIKTRVLHQAKENRREIIAPLHNVPNLP